MALRKPVEQPFRSLELVRETDDVQITSHRPDSRTSFMQVEKPVCANTSINFKQPLSVDFRPIYLDPEEVSSKFSKFSYSDPFVYCCTFYFKLVLWFSLSLLVSVSVEYGDHIAYSVAS